MYKIRKYIYSYFIRHKSSCLGKKNNEMMQTTVKCNTVIYEGEMCSVKLTFFPIHI